MKNKSIYLVFTILMVCLFSCQPKKQNNPPTAHEYSSKAAIEVVDFHVTHRCKTCHAIEENARQTLNQFFSKELENGTISFQVVNVDLPENSVLAEQFQAFGSSLYLRINKEDQSEIIDLTDFAFMNALNDYAFETGFKQKIETYL